MSVDRMNEQRQTAAPSCTVRFYVLPDAADIRQRLQLTCTLVEKAVQEHLRVFILCTDQDMLGQLDTLLWSFKPDSFIPHCSLYDEAAKYCHVWLAVAPERVREADVLINLSVEPSIDIPRHCQRVLEVVTQQHDVLQATRTRFRLYQQNGLVPQTHKL